VRRCELTGDSKLRLGLVQSRKHRTVIATEIFARLRWCFFAETEALPRHARVGYWPHPAPANLPVVGRPCTARGIASMIPALPDCRRP
jgi:hypothetical protein